MPAITTISETLPERMLNVFLGGALLLAAALTMSQPSMQQNHEAWIEQLRGFIEAQRSLVEGTSFQADPSGAGAMLEPYLGQLELVRNLFRNGDAKGTYVAMNRFMDMLETREGGISDGTAEAMWDYCYEVTPAKFHDQSRHIRKARPRITFDEWASRQPHLSPPAW